MSDQKSPDKPDEEGEVLTSQPDQEKRKEIGGPKGLEPTRYGDWEINGRCIDF